MADLFSEQILERIAVLLKTTTTAGDDVERDRDVPVDSDNSLTIEQGENAPLDIQGNAFVDSKISVSIVAAVRKNKTYSSQINLIKKEVYAVLMTYPRNIGLSNIVSNVMWEGDEKPEVHGDGNKTVMKMSINFDVYYQHSIADAGA